MLRHPACQNGLPTIIESFKELLFAVDVHLVFRRQHAFGRKPFIRRKVLFSLSDLPLDGSEVAAFCCPVLHSGSLWSITGLALYSAFFSCAGCYMEKRLDLERIDASIREMEAMRARHQDKPGAFKKDIEAIDRVLEALRRIRVIVAKDV
jgi:hypothetical protein